MLPKFMMMSAAFLMASLMQSCVGAPPPAAPSSCGWLHKFNPNPGFEMRWTRDEKRQAVELNRDIEMFCRMPPP